MINYYYNTLIYYPACSLLLLTSRFVVGIYLTVTMAMTSLSIMLTVFVLQLHHAGPHQSVVPGWLRTLVIGHIARALCMRSHLASFYGPSTSGHKEHMVELSKASKKKGKYSLAPIETESESDRQTIGCNGRSGTFLAPGETQSGAPEVESGRGGTGMKRPSGAWTERWKMSHDARGSRPSLNEHVLARHLKIYVSKHESEQAYEDIVNEWRLVAHIMDRLLFWLFLVGSLVSTVSILVLMPLTKPPLNFGI